MYEMKVTSKQTQRFDVANAKSRDLLGNGVQGAKPPAGARGILTLPGGQVIGGQLIGDPLFLLFPKGWVMMH